MRSCIGATLPIFFLFIGLAFSAVIVDTTLAADDASSAQPEINYIEINTLIDNNYATTEIKEEFENTNEEAVDDTFSVQIPERAFISNFSLTMDNTIYYAKVVEQEQAKQEYNEAVESGSNAALVESEGRSTFSYSISLSPGQKITVSLKYEEYIEKSLGGYNYQLYLTSGNIKSYAESLKIKIDIKSELAITDVSLENYKDSSDVTFDSEKGTITYETTSLPPKQDFIVNYVLESVGLNGKMFNYNDGTSGFFMHVFSPQTSDLGGSPMAKDIIFVLDKSGSMAGTKMEQLQSAFDEIVHELRDGDHFNVIMFDNTIKKYNTELIQASSTNKDDAAEYINAISASGSTNINGALTTGLGMFGDTSETVPIIVFLTDGLPTAGTTDTAQIRANVKSSNAEEVAIFSLGFGSDVDFPFLKALSLENEGHALRIDAGEDAAEQLTNFYDTISTPLLKDLTFEYLGKTSDYYPKQVDQIFEGSEVVVVGKYDLTVSGISGNIYATGSDGKRTFSQTFAPVNGTDHSFIPRLWAYARIQALLDQITVEGSNETAQGEIVTMALEYEFVTPYTSLLITVDEPDEEETEEEESLSNEEKEPLANPGSSTHGTAKKDSDGDGVLDHNDAYPNDGARWKAQDNPSFYGPNGGGEDDKDQEDVFSSESGSLILCFPIVIIGAIILITLIAVLIKYSRKSRKI